MDRLIKYFDSARDGDLRIVEHRGVAYQKDMSVGRVEYDEDYLKKCQSYADTEISKSVNAGRCALISRHLPDGAALIDIGAGSGEFVRQAQSWGFEAKGFDVIHETAKRLKAAGLYADNVENFEAVTMWDVIEHMEDPGIVLRSIRKGSHLFVSVPVFDNLFAIRESKHYRPGEHLYYWTAQGFIDWMALYGYRLLEISTHETDAGRESIGAFAFCRDLPDYHDYVAAYKEMHAARHYGSSATELHLHTVAKVVKELKPKSILDFGCGRSDLVAHFWRDGERRIDRYDPAIGLYKRIPAGEFDLVLCCDVMEHIPLASVENVLREIRMRSKTALFTISLKLARAKLPDGSNAHVTLMTKSEWRRHVEAVFGSVREIPSKYESELILLAFPKK